MALVDDQGAVEEFAADRADEAFGDRGKTTCLMQLGKTIEVIHRQRHPHAAAGHIPVVYLTVPPAATPRR